MPRTATLKINGNWDQFTDPLLGRESFKTHGNLAGGAEFTGYVGRLPMEHRAAATAPTVDYVVVSYGTPIAWHDTVSGWAMPEERYSVSTSKAQGRIRTALSVAGVIA